MSQSTAERHGTLHEFTSKGGKKNESDTLWIRFSMKPYAPFDSRCMPLLAYGQTPYSRS